MRVAIAQFMEETNTFVRQRADLEHFRANQLLIGEDVTRRLRGTRVEIGGFLAVLEPAGVAVVPTVAANCVSSGPVTRAAFDAIMGELLERLGPANPIDGVLLALHGAMILEDDPDGEGALLSAVRALVGPRVPIVATLDLHGAITARMVEAADALVGTTRTPMSTSTRPA
jgi:microcystin degradation protein MlrC